MTNYNDGRWFSAEEGHEFWPLHEKTMAYRLWRANETDMERVDFGAVGSMDWKSQYGRTTAFRVVKEYRDPREWWICGATAYTTEEAAKAARSNGVTLANAHYYTVTHVREVAA